MQRCKWDLDFELPFLNFGSTEFFSAPVNGSQWFCDSVTTKSKMPDANGEKLGTKTITPSPHGVNGSGSGNKNRM
jgi:hypothetical protein